LVYPLPIVDPRLLPGRYPAVDAPTKRGEGHGVSRAYSIVKEPARRSVLIALCSAPSTTGRACAIARASAHDNPGHALKTGKMNWDSRNSICANAVGGAHGGQREVRWEVPQVCTHSSDDIE
jgi:hypothetical protein